MCAIWRRGCYFVCRWNAFVRTKCFHSVLCCFFTRAILVCTCTSVCTCCSSQWSLFASTLLSARGVFLPPCQILQLRLSHCFQRQRLPLRPLYEHVYLLSVAQREFVFIRAYDSVGLFTIFENGVSGGCYFLWEPQGHQGTHRSRWERHVLARTYGETDQHVQLRPWHNWLFVFGRSWS